MVTTETLQGVLTADGILQLEHSPKLPAGPVQVTLRSLPAPAVTSEDWWQYLQRVRAQAESAGRSFRTSEEIEADRADFRSGDEVIEAAS